MFIKDKDSMVLSNEVLSLLSHYVFKRRVIDEVDF
jgi:hypothetical protein